ncbi:hypothetical protein [Thermohalobacter berrensis]|uniref:Uncharacterized protein n=1 Tax=Thermohalobacter berrensis TaxID=99594 RepID=A0A419T1B3_9FIRM|nr:hypothetical protein [Thermohalobacter berrensis]RKD31257.1 hypothetical protein BET03_03775 [Thermohalobacter berrensis]
MEKIEKDKDILSMALVNDKIIISFFNDLNNFSNIYYYDLDKNEKINLTNNDNEHLYYTLFRKSIKNECIFRVINKNEIKYLVIEFYHQ